MLCLLLTHNGLQRITRWKGKNIYKIKNITWGPNIFFSFSKGPSFFNQMFLYILGSSGPRCSDRPQYKCTHLTPWVTFLLNSKEKYEQMLVVLKCVSILFKKLKCKLSIWTYLKTAVFSNFLSHFFYFCRCNFIFLKKMCVRKLSYHILCESGLK